MCDSLSHENSDWTTACVCVSYREQTILSLCVLYFKFICPQLSHFVMFSNYSHSERKCTMVYAHASTACCVGNNVHVGSDHNWLVGSPLVDYHGRVQDKQESR